MILTLFVLKSFIVFKKMDVRFSGVMTYSSYNLDWKNRQIKTEIQYVSFCRVEQKNGCCYQSGKLSTPTQCP